MLNLLLILVSSVSLANCGYSRSPRAVGWLTLGDYDSKFTSESKKILNGFNQRNIRLVRDQNVNPSTETIEWSQVSRCLWTCSEEYLLVDYYRDGNKTNPVMKVYVAKDELDPPNEFRTSGYRGMLHFGFLYFGGEEGAIFYVLHPNSWGPYQHRFKTNAFTKFFKKGLSKGASRLAGAATGAVIGSVVPGLGTAIGALVGVAAGELSDDYFGDYLRYIG